MSFQFFLRTICILFILLFISHLGYSENEAITDLTLKQAYKLALKRSETVAINEQVLKEAEGQFWQSLSGVLPQVNYELSQNWADKGSGNRAQRSHYRRFTLSQPLFSGFKEYAAIAGAKALHQERTNQLERARQLLFNDVADAFYLFQSYQEDLIALADIQKALVDREGELKHRQDLGRSRPSEVASAESSLYIIQADAEGVRSQLEVGRQLLEFLIGQPVAGIATEDIPAGTIETMEDLIKRADARPDVQAAKQALIVAQKAVTVARAGFWPTVSVDGDSYPRRSNSDSDWDVTLNVKVPIFNGTTTIGAVKQAKAQEQEAQLLLSQTRRSAILDIQNVYTKFTSSQSQEVALKKAFDASQKNYQLQKEDYSHSLVNNLDVLQALQDWETTHRSYIAVKNETRRFYWNLKVATGDLGHDAL